MTVFSYIRRVQRMYSNLYSRERGAKTSLLVFSPSEADESLEQAYSRILPSYQILLNFVSVSILLGVSVNCTLSPSSFGGHTYMKTCSMFPHSLA